jgi:hypothetical protein
MKKGYDKVDYSFYLGFSSLFGNGWAQSIWLLLEV